MHVTKEVLQELPGVIVAAQLHVQVAQKSEAEQQGDILPYIPSAFCRVARHSADYRVSQNVFIASRLQPHDDITCVREPSL
jgi:hypothetical protein